MHPQLLQNASRIRLFSPLLFSHPDSATITALLDYCVSHLRGLPAFGRPCPLHLHSSQRDLIKVRSCHSFAQNLLACSKVNTMASHLQDPAPASCPSGSPTPSLLLPCMAFAFAVLTTRFFPGFLMTLTLSLPWVFTQMLVSH